MDLKTLRIVLTATSCAGLLCWAGCDSASNEPVIAATLSVTRGNQIKAAEILGLNRNTFAQKDP